MSNSVTMLWLEGVDPERLSTLPGVAALLAHGIDVHLKPQPLMESQQCYYQTFTGMGAGKIGRFDAVRPEKYTAQTDTGIPEGGLGHLLPDVLRAHKLNVCSAELTAIESEATLRSLKGRTYDTALLHLQELQQLDDNALDTLIEQCIEAVPASHVVLLTGVATGPTVAHVNINDFLTEVGLMETVEASNTVVINWDETLAYGLGTGQVWINLRGREPQGVVRAGREFQEVCNALVQELTTSWLDPQTQQPVVEHVYKKDELYTGDYLFKAPDLTVVYRPGYIASERAFTLGLDGSSVQPLKTQARVQTHVPYARMIANGPAFAASHTRTQASLLDFMPTMLYLLGQPIPQNVDGCVIESLFTQAYRGQISVRRVENEGDLLSDEEEGMIVDRLRDLGYLG